MAFTRIQDIFVPEIYNSAIAAELQTGTDALFSSAAVQDDPFLSLQAGSAQGSKVTVPFYKAFTVSDQIGSDDYNTDTYGNRNILTSNARTSAELEATILRRVVNFSAAELARIEAHSDPLGDAASQFARQILKNRNTSVISSLAGVTADNIANDSSDMVTDAHISTGTPTLANEVSRDVVLDAIAQWGDTGSEMGAMVMHSSVFYALMKADSTTFQRDSGQGLVQNYLGVPVVLDNRVTTETIGGNTVYHTYVMAPGAVRWGGSLGESILDVDNLGANGWGATTLLTRRSDIILPDGFSYTGAGNAADSVLAVAGSWNRQYARENVGISVIRSNVA